MPHIGPGVLERLDVRLVVVTDDFLSAGGHLDDQSRAAGSAPAGFTNGGRERRPGGAPGQYGSAGHLCRKAMVYMRQSTLAQVREHTESTARQYGIVEEAARLGWAAARIEVIECDLGLSGRSTERRTGFRDLVSRICLGEVGAIFGLEVSRLARSSADLARLLELARLIDTLVIDADGVYDLRDLNRSAAARLEGRRPPDYADVEARSRCRVMAPSRPKTVVSTPAASSRIAAEWRSTWGEIRLPPRVGQVCAAVCCEW
jgi:hypothetical protein